MATAENSTQTLKYNGQVKWFNNKSGYGFITIVNGEKENMDVFVHHSGLSIEKEQYKYLVQGEYVSFNLAKSTTESHEFQATNVTGVFGGSLMCEVRNENNQSFRERNSKNRKELNYRD